MAAEVPVPLVVVVAIAAAALVVAALITAAATVVYMIFLYYSTQGLNSQPSSNLICLTNTFIH